MLLLSPTADLSSVLASNTLLVQSSAEAGAVDLKVSYMTMRSRCAMTTSPAETESTGRR